MSAKWDYEITLKFIRLYKSHPCLWDFSSKDYKNKNKRDAAHVNIIKEMNISGFSVQDAKNKIKNLRSTYSQENKKVVDSKKSGAGVSSIYVSNIKWLHEMDEVFAKDLKKPVYENVQSTNNEATESQASANTQPATESQLSDFAVPTNNISSVVSQEPKKTLRAKKRTRDIVTAVSDLKKINEDINNSEVETVWDAFGKSVAMQLKTLSVENALLAQCKIQSVLTEFGIKDHREKTASHSAISNYSNCRGSSALSDVSDISFVDSPNIYLAESIASPPQESPASASERIIFVSQPRIETSAAQVIFTSSPTMDSSPAQLIYTTHPAIKPVTTTASSATENSNYDNDIITAAMNAASAFQSNL